MANLTIGYSGGSGGFLLLHFLLLSNQYYCKFREDKSFDRAIKQQWKITDPSQWKSSETWPDNSKTYQSQTSLNKIYFVCNPNDNPEWTSYPSRTLALYTDYQSQSALAYYKKAGWYYSNRVCEDLKFLAYRNLLRNWKEHYQNIKDPTWPKCTSFRDIEKLPESIQQEVLKNPYTHEYLTYQYIMPTKQYQEHWVFDAMLPILNSADIVVRLQDLVNDNGSALLNQLCLPPINKQQLELLELWKKLHPANLLSRIGIHS